ncbi:hypothetical protein BY996DRAFT_6417424 [Phakopsora pachyrhizi]|nr:hypothetical protein BY996DRAFT_6417424 [Phakopsora pachyrhizi]
MSARKTFLQKPRKLSWARIFSPKTESKSESEPTVNAPLGKKISFISKRRSSEPWIQEHDSLPHGFSETISDHPQTPFTSPFESQEFGYFEHNSDVFKEIDDQQVLYPSSACDTNLSRLQEDAQRWLKSIANKNQEARARFQAKKDKAYSSNQTSKDYVHTGLTAPKSAPASNQVFPNRKRPCMNEPAAIKQNFKLKKDTNLNGSFPIRNSSGYRVQRVSSSTQVTKAAL